MVSTASRSARFDTSGFVKSCLLARWMTASAFSAPARMLSRSSRSPRCGRAPLALSKAAAASERARPTTSWPLLNNSSTTAEPIHPGAPVTNMRMALFSFRWAASLREGDDDLRGRDTLELDVHRPLEILNAVSDDGGLRRGDV